VDGGQTSDLHGDYVDPVRQLLTIGETERLDPVKWPDYTSRYGLGPEHIDSLIRMACDDRLQNADGNSSAVWAPVHAWRALGQLRAEAAVAPLLALQNTIVGDIVADAEIPATFGMIGPAAIPHIAEFVSKSTDRPWPVATAMMGLQEIATHHAGCRDECIDILARTLTPDAGSDPAVKGFAVATLLDLRAVQAIDTIREAYRQDLVDPSIAGDIEDVEIALGLRDRRTTRFFRGAGGQSSASIVCGPTVPHCRGGKKSAATSRAPAAAAKNTRSAACNSRRSGNSLRGINREIDQGSKGLGRHIRLVDGTD
jgi:hypothetical protein